MSPVPNWGLGFGGVGSVGVLGVLGCWARGVQKTSWLGSIYYSSEQGIFSFLFGVSVGAWVLAPLQSD